MVSLNQKRQSGFTIVELLIVIVIIGILAGLVVTQILGATAKARDTERKTDLDQIANQLEAYYAKRGGYPTASDLGSITWRPGNEMSMGDQNKSVYDPSETVPGTAANNTFGSNVAPTGIGAYAYVPTPASCNSPTTSAGVSQAPAAAGYCSGYTLAAWIESPGSVYLKKNAN